MIRRHFKMHARSDFVLRKQICKPQCCALCGRRTWRIQDGILLKLFISMGILRYIILNIFWTLLLLFSGMYLFYVLVQICLSFIIYICICYCRRHKLELAYNIIFLLSRYSWWVMGSTLSNFLQLVSCPYDLWIILWYFM